MCLIQETAHNTLTCCCLITTCRKNSSQAGGVYHWLLLKRQPHHSRAVHRQHSGLLEDFIWLCLIVFDCCTFVCFCFYKKLTCKMLMCKAVKSGSVGSMNIWSSIRMENLKICISIVKNILHNLSIVLYHTDPLHVLESSFFPSCLAAPSTTTFVEHIH